MTTAISDAFSRTQVELEGYWSHALGELETHTKQSLSQILEILREFAQRAERLLASPDVKVEFDALVAEIFQSLHALNEAYGEGLLETDEREIVVPLFDEVAKALGLDPNDYEHGDVTIAVRDF